MKVLIFKKTKDADLSEGMTIAYRDQFGEYTKIGKIEGISTDKDRIKMYTVDGAQYVASELKLLDSEDLNDWSRWNKELPEGQKVEISEDVYQDLLNCIFPHRWEGTYFEVGEPHHHDNNGRPIHRACWKEGDKFYTGYPKP